MRLNPNALVFWALLGIVGYLIGGWHDCLIGIAIGLFLSFLAGLFSVISPP